MAKKTPIIICVLLLFYFLFTSGLAFEATGSEDISKMIDMPYSIAFSGERTGVLGLYTEGDIACAKWLAGNEIKQFSAILFMHILADAPEDCWVESSKRQVYLDWWNNDITQHIDAKILPLLDWARKNEMAVVFSSGSCSEGQWELSPKLEIDEHGEPIISDCYELDAYLKERGITTIFYAGYATNVCMLESSTSMRMMHSLGYKTVLIEDCSLPAPAVDYTGEMALEEIRETLDGVVTADELEAMMGGETMIYSDYNTTNLLVGYSDEYDRLVQSPPVGGHYLFLISWNTRHGRMVNWAGSQLRAYQPLPDLSGAVEVFRSGEAVVYYLEGN